MSGPSSNNASEMDYGLLDELCVQTVLVSDEIFHPEYNNELETALDGRITETRDVEPVAAASFPTSKKRRKTEEASKYPVKEDEVLLPCTYCCRTISYENYEKHLATHTFELETTTEIACPVCKNSIPKDTLKLHLTDHINVKVVLPMETVMIKEEMMWDDSEKEENYFYEYPDNVPDISNEVSVDTVLVQAEEPCLIEDTLRPVRGRPKIVQCQRCCRFVGRLEMFTHLETCNAITKRRRSSNPIKKRRIISSTFVDKSTSKTEPKERAEPCKVCHRVVSSVNMEKHMKTHTTGNSLLDNINGVAESVNANRSIANLQQEMWGDGLSNKSPLGLAKMKNCCQICDKNFPPEEIIDHWMTHLNEELTMCPFCGVKFDNVKQFRDHVKFHTEKLFVCCHCDQKFMQYSELREHQARRDDVKRFFCRMCRRAFYQCYHLKLHHVAYHKDTELVVEDISKSENVAPTNETASLTSETDEWLRNDDAGRANKLLLDRRIMCSYCEAMFNDYKELSNHIYTHSKENSVMCTLCGKSVPMIDVVHRRKGVFVCSSCSSTLLENESGPVSKSSAENVGKTLQSKNELPDRLSVTKQSEKRGEKEKALEKRDSTSNKKVSGAENVKQTPLSKKGLPDTSSAVKPFSRKRSVEKTAVKKEEFACRTSEKCDSTSSRSGKYYCPPCDQYFSRETSLKRHVICCHQNS